MEKKFKDKLCFEVANEYYDTFDEALKASEKGQDTPFSIKLGTLYTSQDGKRAFLPHRVITQCYINFPKI